MPTRRGDELIERLLLGGDDPELDGRAAFDLLTEVFNGYPAERIVTLTRSDNDAAVDAGAWIISELVDPALMSEVPFLLDYPNQRVRFHAVDTVNSTATVEHGDIIAKAVKLIGDSDSAVRGAVLYFLAWGRSEQFSAAVQFLPESRIRELMTWLATLSNSVDATAEIQAKLDGPDELSRLFGVAAADRIYEEDPSLLEHAAESMDQQVSAFANHELVSDRRRGSRLSDQ